MLNDRFQDMKQFEFLDLVNLTVFSTWNGIAPPDKFNHLKEMYGRIVNKSNLALKPWDIKRVLCPMASKPNYFYLQ